MISYGKFASHIVKTARRWLGQQYCLTRGGWSEKLDEFRPVVLHVLEVEGQNRLLLVHLEDNKFPSVT